MTQQYGLRASLDLAEIANSTTCVRNLGIDVRDLALLEGTSSAGVTQSDYQAIAGLSGNLELQISTANQWH